MISSTFPRPALSLAFLFCAAAAGAAQEVQVSGDAGWGGHYRPGEWTPVILDVDNLAGEQEVRILVTWAAPGDEQETKSPTFDSLYGKRGPVHQLAIVMPEKSRKTFSFTLLAPDRGKSSVWACVVPSKGKSPAASELRVQPMRPNKRLLAIVGTERPAGISPAEFDLGSIQPDRLPEDWRAYASLDALLWLDADGAKFRLPAQIDALKAWISSGGTFVLARSHPAGVAGTELVDLLPVRIAASREAPDLNALEKSVQSGDAFPEGKAAVLDATLLSGSAVVTQEEHLLVARAARDGGRTIFVGFDPSAVPFRGWKGAPLFWNRVLDLPTRPAEPSEDGGARNRDDEEVPRVVGSPAFAGLVGLFPGIIGPAIGRLFLVIIIFLGVAGPADYVVLRLLKRLELTWLTFPAVVLGFTALVLSMGAAFMRGSAHQRETAVLDYYPETRFVHRRAIEAILASENTTLRFNGGEPLDSDYRERRNRADAAKDLSEVRIVEDRDRKVRDWKLQRGATGLAVVDSCGEEASPVTYAIDKDESTQVVLSVRNDLKSDLADALFVSWNGIYKLGDIGRGRNEARSLEHYPSSSDLPELKNRSHSWLPRDTGFEGRSDRGIPEPQLNASVRSLLLGFCFGESEAKANSGFARGLNFSRWTDDGGTVLLATLPDSKSQLAITPEPRVRTATVLIRVFQGPKR